MAQPSLFESYEASYCTAATAVSESLSRLTGLPSGEQSMASL